MWYSSPLSLRNDLSQPGTWHLYLLWSISMISSLGAKTKWIESTMNKPGQSKERSESSSALPKNTTPWRRPGLEIRLTAWSAVQRANYTANTPTKAKLFERQLMLTQDYKLMELLIFLVYVLCSLRLYKLKTEGQPKYKQKISLKSYKTKNKSSCWSCVRSLWLWTTRTRNLHTNTWNSTKLKL